MLHSEAAEWSLFWLPPSDEQSAFTQLCCWFGFLFLLREISSGLPAIYLYSNKPDVREGRVYINFASEQSMPSLTTQNDQVITCFISLMCFWMMMSSRQKYFNSSLKFPVMCSLQCCPFKESHFGLIHRNKHSKGGNMFVKHFREYGFTSFVVDGFLGTVFKPTKFYGSMKKMFLLNLRTWICNEEEKNIKEENLDVQQPMLFSSKSTQATCQNRTDWAGKKWRATSFQKPEHKCSKNWSLWHLMFAKVSPWLQVVKNNSHCQYLRIIHPILGFRLKV